MRISLPELARLMGSLSMAPEAMVTAWSIDTRTMPNGALYIALPGERFDGHDFVGAALAKGAVAAVVKTGAELGVAREAPLIRVEDTLAAMQELARRLRRRMQLTMVGVTGSAGKTSTKETIAALLAPHLRVAKNEGNLNNHIGVPLSLLRFEETAEVGVMEMGMNHAGEIRFLAGIAAPDIGVVTNVGTAHIENFESIEGIAAAKRELIEALPAGGAAVLNADDTRVAAFRGSFAGRCVTFGFGADADFRAENMRVHAGGSEFTIRGTKFSLPVLGRHAVLNVAAAAAVGTLLGVPMETMAGAATQLRPGRMRGELLAMRGTTVIDDTYNSNPEAAKMMIENLRAMPAARHVAVLGEMRELGAAAGRLHAEVGAFAAQAGVGLVIGIRGAAAELVAAARAAGLGGGAHFFETPEEAGEALREMAREGDAILFKGSRGTAVEKALERFMAP